MKYPRRKFLDQTGKTFLAGSVMSAFPFAFSSCDSKTAKTTENTATETEATNTKEASPALFFQISLAQWSLHRMIHSGELDNVDFAPMARNEFGIEAVEYVNQFFKDKAKDQAYLGEMKAKADGNGVKSLLIMIDGEGNLGDIDEANRIMAVENHYPWVEAAKFLGCHSIRVNAGGQGTAEEVSAAAIDGLGRLATFAQELNINVIVENHGGYSSDGTWLSNVISSVNMSNCGTLPDFGNFCIERKDDACVNEYDRYKGIQELMPYAKGVSAKSHDFDAQGNEIHTDFKKALQIVKRAGYIGHIGIEYEGNQLSEVEGIKNTKDLLEKVGAELS